MSLATLERNKQKYTGSRVIKSGLKLYCIKSYYGFTCNNYYRIYEINNGYITVHDNDKRDVIFISKEELQKIFMIIFE